MDDKAKRALRATLADMDKATAAIDASLDLVRKPFVEASLAIEEAREKLLEFHEADVAGNCEGCSALLLVGDQGHRCVDGCLLCEACTPTFGDLKTQTEEAGESMDDEDREANFKSYDDHIAAGGLPTDKCLHTL